MKTITDPAQLPACDVLAFGPHPDDVEIACGGTLLLLQQQGHSVALVDCTRGEMGSRGTVVDRDREAIAAGTALGVVARCNLGLPDTGIRDDDDATMRAVAAMRAVQPKIVFAPHERDVHPDHTAAAHMIARAHFLAGLRNYQPQLGQPHRARILLHYPGNQPVEPTLVVDITAVADQVAGIVRCYRTQLIANQNEAGTTETATPESASTSHLVQGLDLLERTIVRQRATGAMIGAHAGEGFCHDGPLPMRDLACLIRS